MRSALHTPPRSPRGLSLSKVVGRFIPFVSVAVFFLLSSIANNALAQGGSRGGLARMKGTVSVGAAISSFGTPIVRHPSGGPELPIEQSRQTAAFRASWFPFAMERVALEVGLSYWKARFAGFEFRERQQPASEPSTTYSAPEVSLVFFDVALHVAPSKRVPWSVYGVLGMGSEGEKYTVSGATFSEWNGAKSNRVFQFSYGLGTRAFPVRYVSLFAEFRFVPGDLSTPGGTCYMFVQGSTSWDTCGGSFPNKSTLLTLGGAIHFP